MTRPRRATLAKRAFWSSALAGVALAGFAGPAAAEEDESEGPFGVVGAAADEDIADAGTQPSVSSTGLSNKKKRRIGLGGAEAGLIAEDGAASLGAQPDVQSLLPGFPGLQGPLPLAPTLPGGVSLLPGGQGVFPSAPAPAPSAQEHESGAPAPAARGLHGPLGLGHPSSGPGARPGGASAHGQGTTGLGAHNQGAAGHTGSGASGEHHTHP